MDGIKPQFVEFAWDTTPDPGGTEDHLQMDRELDRLHPEAVESLDLFRRLSPPHSPYMPSPTGSNFSSSSISPAVVVNGVTYSGGEVRVMADLLIQARQNKEFPASQYPHTDPVAIVEDWDKLRALRDARGDPALAPPEEYLALRVSVAEKIKERDAKLTKEAEERKESQLANSALAGVPDKDQLSEMVQGVLSSVAGQGTGGMTGVDIHTVSEKIVSLVENAISDSSSQLRSNIDRMDDQIGALHDQNEALKAQIDILAGAINGQLGPRIAAFSSIPLALQGPLYEAICRAFRDVMAEAFQAVEDFPRVARRRHSNPALPPIPALSRPPVETRRVSERIAVRPAAHNDRAFPSIRDRKARAHRPSRVKENVGTSFAEKEAEDSGPDGNGLSQ